MRKALSKIEVPVLIISSSSDRTVPACLTDELEKGLKNVKRVVLQTKNGHLGYLQPQGTPEYELRASGAFLDSLGKCPLPSRSLRPRCRGPANSSALRLMS
jgi:pimeloyl-ACP methyl ester carboxylesterase